MAFKVTGRLTYGHEKPELGGGELVVDQDSSAEEIAACLKRLKPHEIERLKKNGLLVEFEPKPAKEPAKEKPKE